MAKDIIWGNILSLKGKTDTLFDFLKNTPLFSGFSPKDIKNIEKIVHLRKFKKNEIVFKEDEPGTGMYIIKKGAVRISKQTPNGASQGREEIISTFKKNDFFGEITLLEKAAFERTASAYANSESELVGLFKPDLLDIIERNPKLGIKIVMRISEIMAARLRSTTTAFFNKTVEITEIQSTMQNNEEQEK